MRLPNFFSFEPLNALKDGMGVPRDHYGDISKVSVGRLVEDDLTAKLDSIEGVEIVSLDELSILDDGTLCFKNRRVLLYIRDVEVYGDRESDPRFHIAHCRKLQEMKRQNRFERYVISTRIDGTFSINFLRQAKRTSEMRRLSVCQLCLNKLRYAGFSMGMAQHDRVAAVNRFTVAAFFEKYAVSLHEHEPTYDSDNAPSNSYNDGFSDRSRKFRFDAKYRCQNCGLDLSAPNDQRFLHTHHRNGLKYDDRPENFEALCLGCHAEEYNHGHMKPTPEYTAFRGRFPYWQPTAPT